MKTLVPLAIAALCLAACAPPLVRERVDVDGVPITVIHRADGTWAAVPAGVRMSHPASNIPLYIRGIEAVSGCRVNRDAMTTEVWIVEAAVICSQAAAD